MTYLVGDQLKGMLFAPSNVKVEVEQVVVQPTLWYTELMERCCFAALWPWACGVVVGTCGFILLVMMAKKAAKNKVKIKNKLKSYSYSNIIETVRVFYKQTALKLFSWFSKPSHQNHQLSRKTPLAKAQQKATLRAANSKQEKNQKDGLNLKDVAQKWKNGVKPAPIADDVARRSRPQPSLKACEDTPRCISTPEISSDQNALWSAGERLEKNRKTELSRRLNDFKRKASVAKLRGSKNAKIVWGATGPVKVDQFKGEMCIYPKKAEDSMPCSETISEVMYESMKNGRKEIVSDFRQQKAMFVQVNKSDKRIVIDTVTGATNPMKTYSSKFTSAVNVDEATSDLIMGNLKTIRKKYSNESVLSAGDIREENPPVPAPPLVPRTQNQRKEGKKEPLPNEAVAPRPEPLSIEKSGKVPRAVKIDAEQKTKANEKLAKDPQHVDNATQMSHLKSSSSIQKATVNNYQFDKGSSTRQSLTSLVYGQMKKNKNAGLLRCEVPDKLQGIINTSLFTNKSGLVNSNTTPLNPNSVNNNEKTKTVQKESSRLNTYTLRDENNWKDLASESTESYHHRILSDIEESHEKSPWSSDKLDELNDTQSIFLESLSSDTKASDTFDTLFNVSEYSLRETLKSCRDYFLEWYRGEASSSGRMRSQAASCSSANDMSTRSSTYRSVDPGTYSLNGVDTVSWCKTVPSAEDTETPEDSYQHGFQDLHAATYGAKKLAFDLLEGKPPPGKPKMSQERNATAKSEKDFKPSLDETNENPLRTYQCPTDTQVFEKYKGNETTDDAYFNSLDQGDSKIGQCDPSQVAQEACAINMTTETKKGRCSPLSIFGGQLPRRIIPKESLLPAGYSGYPDRKARVLKAEYRETGDSVSTPNIKPNMCTCEQRSSRRPFNSQQQQEDESLGTSTMEVFNCLIHSADRLNTIYANSSRKQVTVGAMRNKLNNVKYRPYVIPRNQEKRRASNHVNSKSFTQEKSQSLSKPNSFSGTSAIKFQRKQNTALGSQRYSLSSTVDSRSSKRCNVVLEKPLAQRLSLVPKGAMLASNVRLLQQRPVMSHNTTNTGGQTKVNKGPDSGLSPTSGANEKRKRANIFLSRKRTSKSPRELRIKEESGEFKRRVSDSGKAYVLKGDRAHRNLGNKTSFLAEMVSENLTITKNICMIESLRTESFCEDTKSESQEKREESDSVTTPLPTQVEQKKVATDVPTPTRSVTLLPQVKPQNTFATFMKPHDNFTSKMQLISPVEKETFRALSEMTFYGSDKLMNITSCPMRTVNYIFKDKTKDEPVTESTHKRNDSPVQRKRTESDSQVYFPQNRLIEKSDELSAIWSPTVNATPLYSPERMRKSYSSQPESRVNGDNFKSSVHSEHNSNDSTQLQKSHPSIQLSTMPTKAKRMASEARNVSRIPRYVSLHKPLKKSAKSPTEPPNSTEMVLRMNMYEKSPLALHRKEETKRRQQATKTNKLLSLRRQRLKLTNKANDQKDRKPSSRSPIAKLESPGQTKRFQKITVENTEKGIQSVLPLLMSHTKDSIIIITPEKKVKHLNVIVNKRCGLLDALERSTNSNMLIQDLPILDGNKIEFGGIVPESNKKAEDIFLDTGPEMDDSQNTNKVKEIRPEVLHTRELNIKSGKKQDVSPFKGRHNEDVSGKSSIGINKIFKGSNSKTCRLRGRNIEDNDTRDIGEKKFATSHQQHTMKVDEQPISRQKKMSRYDFTEKDQETSKSTVKDSIIQKESVKSYARKKNLVKKQSPTLRQNKNVPEKNKIETPTCVNTPQAQAMNSSIRVNKIAIANGPSQTKARKSKIPRLTKKTAVMPMKNIEEEANVSQPRADDQKDCESPIKVLTGEDYRIASIASDFHESHVENVVDYEAANKGHSLPTAVERAVENVYRKRIPVLKIAPVAKRSRAENILEEASETPNSGKHNSITKKMSPKRERILEKKFTIKLDIAKPTACYPVCGNNETHSLNDTFSENLDLDQMLDFMKAEENCIKVSPGKSFEFLHEPIIDTTKSNKVSKDLSLVKGVTGNKSDKQKQSNALPTKCKAESPQESNINKKFKLKIDNSQQNPIDDKTEKRPKKTAEIRGQKCSIDKKTDSLMKGMASYEVQPIKLSRETTPNETKPTSLRRKKSTLGGHDSFVGAPTAKKIHMGTVKKAQHPQKGQYSKNVSVSSVGRREAPGHDLGENVSSVDQEVDPANEQQLPRKSEKILDCQRQMFFSNQSPTKRVKKSRQHSQTQVSARNKEPVSSSNKSLETSPEKHLSRGSDEGVVMEAHLEMVKLLRPNASADSLKVPNVSSDIDCSTTMPTTEAEMRIASKMETGPFDKKGSLQATVTRRKDAKDARHCTREGHGDFLTSDHVQGMLNNLRAEEREVLIKRLKDWIENRLSQTKNESDTSTEAIVGNELEHIFQVIISSLDTNTLKSVYSKIQPKLEHLDKIIEVEEKSDENSKSQNSVRKDCDQILHAKAMNETENNRKSATWNKSARKIVTKKRFQNFKMKRPTFYSRLPVRDSSLGSSTKPESNGNLFQALVDMQRKKFVSQGQSPQSRPERRVSDFVKKNFRGKFDIRTRKLSDTEYRSENGSGNAESSNQHLKRPSSPKGSMRKAFSTGLDNPQQVSELKSKRLNVRFPSVSSISCYDLGATYVASSKSPLPIQTASYVIYKKKSAQDESLRSLPRDLIMGSSGQSERWTPFSRGRLSDYMQELDLRDSYRALGSRDQSEYDESLFRCIASNSSAEVILSWLARTPEIDLSADRAIKRDGSLKNMGLGSANILSSLPVSLPQDKHFLTGEKGSPWPENLEQKSVSPLDLTDLDSNLQVLTSKLTSSDTKNGHNGKTADSVKTGSAAKSIPASLVREDHASAGEASGEGKDKGSKRYKEHGVSRAESLKNSIREMENVNANEDRASNDGKEVSRKEENESFNNRVGRGKMSRQRYVNQTRHIFNERRQLAFIMPNSNTTRFAHQESLSTVGSNYPNNLLPNEEQYVKSANPLDESLMSVFTDSSKECKQIFVHNSPTITRKCYTKGGPIVDCNGQKENESQKDSNPNCLGVMYSWSKSPSEDNGAQHERSILSLDEHINTYTPSGDIISPGKGAAKKWVKSEASTLSHVSFDWYKPSSVNPGQPSIEAEQSLQIGRREDNEIDHPESHLQETKEKGDECFKAFQTWDGRDASKCHSITHNASSKMIDTESNKHSQLRDPRDAADAPDCFEMSCHKRSCDEDRCRQMGEEHIFERKDELDVGLRRYAECKKMQQDVDALFANSCPENAMRTDNSTSSQHEYHEHGSHRLVQSCTTKNVSGESSTSSWNRASPRHQPEGLTPHRSFGPDRSLFTGDKSSMRSVISRYEYADMDGYVSFASAREKSRKCSLSFSSIRSHCEDLKSESVTRSGYRYKTMDKGMHGASMPGFAILKRTHRSFNDNYAEPNRSSYESLSSYSRPFSTAAHFDNDWPSFDLCKSVDAKAVTETRPPHPSGAGRKHRMGFSYLFSENWDKGAGTDGSNGGAGAASTAGAPRLAVVRTRRPKMNTMVGQIVKMFERRLQFRPVQN